MFLCNHGSKHLLSLLPSATSPLPHFLYPIPYYLCNHPLLLPPSDMYSPSSLLHIPFPQSYTPLTSCKHCSHEFPLPLTSCYLGLVPKLFFLFPPTGGSLGMRLPAICATCFTLTTSLPLPPAICAIALPSLPPSPYLLLSVRLLYLHYLPPLTSCYLCNHVDHLVQGDVATLAMSQVLQETAMLHQLCDNIDGLLQRTDGVQLKQVWMVDLFHHLCFCDKVFYLHCA